MSGEKVLSKEDLERLVEVVRSGDAASAQQAREKLTVAFIPLAGSVAKKYEGKLGHSLAYSASMFGLVMAMKSWQPDKGALSSWIRLYCKSALLRELDKQPTIKMPQDFAARHAMFLYHKKRGNDPAIELNLTPEQVREHERVPTVLYLDDDNTILARSPEENDDTALFAEALLSSLPEEDQAVMKARFGIGVNGMCHSYEEIAMLTGKQVEDIMAQEARCLATLKEAAASPSLCKPGLPR
jgi:RNA polymerase sigma factor (sigma-70 family)